MIGMDILKPAVVLMAWTMVMWLWMYATRIPAMTKANVDPDKLVNDPEVTLDRALPPQVQWKAHNYNHLHEAPTVFLRDRDRACDHRPGGRLQRPARVGLRRPQDPSLAGPGDRQQGDGPLRGVRAVEPGAGPR